MNRRVMVRQLAESPTEGIEQATLEEFALPVPSPGEVLVEVRATQVNWVDLLMTSGQYQHVPPLPFSPGLEFAGVVATNGSRWRVGDAVLADGIRTGPRSSTPYAQCGGWSTHVLAPESALHAVPAGFSFSEATCLLANYETAWHALVASADVQKGETVLIHGASGATGLAAVHVAKRLGARVIATGRSAEKLAFVKSQGADDVVQIGADGRFRDAVKELTGGKGADVVYDGVGGDVSTETLRCVAFGARFIIVGWASTPAVAPGKGLRGAPNVNTLPTNLILMKGLKVIGSPAVIAAEKDPALRDRRLQAVLRLAGEGMKPIVAVERPLEEFREAMREKWAGTHVGGVVLVP